jgi:hypothetical protein
MILPVYKDTYDRPYVATIATSDYCLLVLLLLFEAGYRYYSTMYLSNLPRGIEERKIRSEPALVQKTKKRCTKTNKNRQPTIPSEKKVKAPKLARMKEQ